MNAKYFTCIFYPAFSVAEAFSNATLYFFLSIFVPDPLTIVMAWFLLAKHFDNGFTLEMYCSVSIFFTIWDSVYSNSTSLQIM